LKKLGLNRYESKAYLVLVKYRNLTAKEIAEKSGVPPTAIYPNLKSLASKRLISLINKDPLTYEMIDPDIALESFMEQRRSELNEAKKRLVEQIKSTKLQTLEENQDERLNLLYGWSQSASLVKKLLSESKKEYLLMSGMSRKTALSIIHPLKEALRRGVKVQFIIIKTPKDNINLLKDFLDLGVEIKYYPMKNFAVEIKDAKESVLVLRNPELKDRIVIHLNNEDLAKAHRDYFLSVWKKAHSIDRYLR